MTADRQQELLPPLHSLFASFLLLLVSLTNQMSCIRKRLLLITKVSRNSLISSSALNRQHKRTFSLPLELLPAPGGAFPQKEPIFFSFILINVYQKTKKKKEKIEENLCHLTRTEWEGLKTMTDPWPFLRDQGGIDLSIISVSLSLSLSCTHFIFSTCAQTNMHCCMKCCCCTCRWGFGLCDERRHGRVGVQPVAKHVGGGQVEDRAWESAHLWTETNKQWHMRHKKPHFLSDLTLYNIMAKPAVFR